MPKNTNKSEIQNPTSDEEIELINIEPENQNQDNKKHSIQSKEEFFKSLKAFNLEEKMENIRKKAELINEKSDE